MPPSLHAPFRVHAVRKLDDIDAKSGPGPDADYRDQYEYDMLVCHSGVLATADESHRCPVWDQVSLEPAESGRSPYAPCSSSGI